LGLLRHRKGKERKGKERKGKERKGKERKVILRDAFIMLQEASQDCYILRITVIAVLEWWPCIWPGRPKHVRNIR
jgi:hypothetical protein